MKEEAVFWLGGKPGAAKQASAPPAAQQLEPVLMAACRQHGLEPEDFVAALGGYGSWLIHASAADGRRRVVWNGREGMLVLQAPLRSGGWEDLGECPVSSADQAGFVAAVAALLAPRSTGA